LERDATILAAAARHGSQANDNAHLAYIEGDAEHLSDYFAPGEIQTLYIHFCDPWPNKKKWAKRRLTHRRFLNLYRQLAIGSIIFKTDSRKLFEFSLEQFSEAAWRLQNISLDLYAAGASSAEMRFMTEYEEKFVSQQVPIYRFEAYEPFLEVSPYERTNQQAEKSSASNVLQSAQE
jgi:tRNA (guanine-N7-)-methyltransferase